MLMFISFLLVSFILGLIMLLMTHFLSKKVFLSRETLSPFECGFSTMSEGRLPFSLRFFLVALIFLIFDVELIMLFPFVSGVCFAPLSTSIFLVFTFLFILSIGLFHEWNQTMLEWAE